MVLKAIPQGCGVRASLMLFCYFMQLKTLAVKNSGRLDPKSFYIYFSLPNFFSDKFY